MNSILPFDQETIAGNRIYLDEAFQRLEAVASRQARFVHYTSAEVAFSILEKREVWMRRPQLMNDFQEMEWGYGCLRSAWDQGIGSSFRVALDGLWPGSSDRILGEFDRLLPSIKNNTFITCISEHGDNEDEYGRLSMWRAYARPAGVALVLRPQAFLSLSDALDTYIRPVFYHRLSEVGGRLLRVLDNMHLSRDYLLAQGEEFTHFWLHELLQSVVLCTKHPGFHEEREWRIVHTCYKRRSPNLDYRFATVRGVPQQIVGLKLEDRPEDGLVGAAIPDLIDRIIIGPHEFADETGSVLLQLLGRAGVVMPHLRVWTSNIPVRQSA